MERVRVRGRVCLGATGATLVALALACGADKNSPDADADWHGSTSGQQTGGGEETEPSPEGDDTGGTADDTGDTGDTGQAEPEEVDCSTLEAVTWALVPQDTNGLSTPVQARASVLEGWRELSHVSIRAYEFLNYFHFDHPQPAAGSLGLSAQLRQDERGGYVLHLATTSPPAERPPINLAISVDTSGSMGETDLSLARSAIVAVAGALQPGDVVSVLSWDSDQQVLLSGHEVAMPYDLAVMTAAGQLDSGGATDLHAGLVAAYQQVEAHWISGGLNRVLLISDGQANLGQTDVQLISEMAGERGQHGIFLTGVGVGDAVGYHDGLMDSVTDAGHGAGLFLATADDARALVEERFAELFDVAALDLGLELTLPPGFVRLDTEPDPRQDLPEASNPRQNLAPGRSLVLHQVLGSQCPDAVSDGLELSATVRWIDPASGAEHSTSATWTLGELLAGDTDQVRKSEAVLAYAEALKQLKNTVPREQAAAALAEARTRLVAAQAALPGDADLAEIDAILSALEH